MSPAERTDLEGEASADPVVAGTDGEAEAVGLEQEADERAGSARDRALAPLDPLRRYLAEIRKYPPLTRGEEVELVRRYRESGDRQALFRLVTANLMLVVRVALSFRRAANNVLDLIQEGNLGLLQAIERFDPGLGVRLPTYAVWWIRAFIVKYLLDNVRLVRVGTTNARRKLIYNLRQEKARLEAAGFEVGPKLLAEHFGVSERDVVDVEAALESREVSLDAPVSEGEDGRTRGDLVAASGPTAEEEAARRELRERTQAAIAEFRKGLNEKEKAILDLRILSEDPLTLQALGDRFGTTREAVRQVEARLLSRLKGYLRDKLGDLAQIRIGPD